MKLALISIWTYGSIFGSFYFLGLCKTPINSGVISSIFSTSLVFVAILFYLVFGQRMSSLGVCGIGLIVTSVCMISLSAESHSSMYAYDSNTEDNDTKYIHLSIGCALVAGLTFAMTALFSKTVIMHYEGWSLI